MIKLFACSFQWTKEDVNKVRQKKISNEHVAIHTYSRC